MSYDEATKVILAELNAGRKTIDDVLSGLSSSQTMIKAGSGFRPLINERPQLLNGRIVKVCDLGPKIDADGKPVTPKPRKTQAVATAKKK